MAAANAYVIDKSIFAKTVEVPALKVPTKQTDSCVKALRSLLAEIPKVKPVQKTDDDASHRYLLLTQPIREADGSIAAAHQPLLNDIAARFPHTPECCPGLAGSSSSAGGAASAPAPALITWPLHLGYENMGAEQILRTLLPASVEEIPSAFEAAGHVAHVNLKDEALPYKHIIGAVLLDKNPTIRTVVNKTASIESKFRTFPMEVLAGDGNTQVQVRHCGATFRFDFRTVYWNSRLQKEHEHMVNSVVPEGCVVADVFCGVGPFAVPAALSRGCTVHANDLNPASFAALQDNVARNKVTKAVTCYNMDGRAFILHMGSSGVPFAVALMNLPADALTFLDAFVGLWRHPRRAQAEGQAGPEAAAGAGAAAAAGGSAGSSAAAPQTFVPRPLPVVHCYCFSKAEAEADAADDVAARALQALGLTVPTPEQAAAAAAAGSDPSVGGAGGPGGIDSPVIRAARTLGILPDLTVRTVRDVAPRKLMLCVSFTLPRAVAEAAPVVTWEQLEEEDRLERERDAAAMAAEEAAAGAAGAAGGAGAGAGAAGGAAAGAAVAEAQQQQDVPAQKRARME